MVKFTTTVVAASLLAGTALAAPFSRSDNVEVTARDIEALFGREMVEYAERSPAHHNEVVTAVHVVKKIHEGVQATTGTTTDRREYSSFVAREHGHEHGHGHPHNFQHPHGHPHHHPHAQAPEAVDPAASAPPAASSDGGARRRSLDSYDSFYAREHGHEHGHGHPHNFQHPHGHPHHHPHAQAPESVDPAASAPPAASSDGGARRRSLYAREGDGVTPDASTPAVPVHHNHAGQHPHHPHASPEAMAKWHAVFAQIHAHQHGAGAHPHPHPHHAQAAPAVSGRSYDGGYSSFLARETGTTASSDPVPAVPAPAVDASTPAPVGHPHPHGHIHGHGHNHLHPHVPGHVHHNHPLGHPHHLHHSSSTPSSPVADATAPAPVVNTPGRRSLDFDELYTRFYDIDELD